jgi:hypothetical protein
MKFLGLCGVLLAAGLATGGAKAQEAAVKELIPTGKLRFGVAFAPKMSALFVVKDADGSPRGVTADLGNELAQRLGVPIEFMVAPNTGVLTDALASRPRTLEPVKENNGIDTYYIEFGGGLAPRTLVRDIGAPPPIRIGD